MEKTKNLSNQDRKTLKSEIDLLEQILRQNPSDEGKKELEDLQEEYKGLGK